MSADCSPAEASPNRARLQNPNHVEDDRQYDPIAICGLGCRLPGGASSPSKLWDFLQKRQSAHGTVPASRFNIDGFYHPAPAQPHSVNSTGGYFLHEDPRVFDNKFFGINNVEAKYMDPQQRKLLEVVYECFENAGLLLDELSGANVGSYVANFTPDYGLVQSKDPEFAHRYTATGMGVSILANRVNHVFNLKGPSMVVDTACSSSLFALHTACTALQANDCDAAIVAGANLIQTPEPHISISKAGLLSPTSKCHTFDSSADGYGRGEGIGALYLKRLSDAVRCGDPVRAVIRATATTSNGRTNGITLPDASEQEAVIRKAYAKARLSPNDTDYVEAHGTGTPVGDPIEIDALSRVFRRSDRPTFVGSIKPSLGHGEAVSGLSSVIKCVLALENRIVPPTVGIQNLNPNLKIEETNLKIATEPLALSNTPVPRTSINSFGYGGANAHAILEAANVTSAGGHLQLNGVHKAANSPLLLPFSANARASLEARVCQIAGLDFHKHSIRDIVYTLGARLSKLPIRGFAITKPAEENYGISVENLNTLPGHAQASSLPLTFVFTGQGAQWPEVGRQLLDRYPSFKDTVQRLDSALAHLPDAPAWSLLDVICEPEATSHINDALHAQPVCTAIQIGLVNLLAQWQVKPKTVIGHSSGEIAAAFAAGHLSAPEAICIAYYRGLIVSSSTQQGAMIAVSTDSADALQEINSRGLGEQVRIACKNSPNNVTISGESKPVEELLSCFQDKGLFARKLRTGGKAYHSQQMLCLGQDYERYLEDILPQEVSFYNHASVTMISTVATGPVKPQFTRQPQYWRTNLESTVLFAEALEHLFDDHRSHIVEIGPHPALKMAILETQKKCQMTVPYTPSLVRKEDSTVSVLRMAGDLYLHGQAVSIQAVNSTIPGVMKNARFVQDLPAYPWDHGQINNHEPRISEEYRARKYPRHDLLGSFIPGGNGKTRLWRNVIRVSEIPWLEDHKLGDAIVFPAAGYLAMSVEAIRQALNIEIESSFTVHQRDINFLKGLALSDNDEIELLTQLNPLQVSNSTDSQKWWQWEISSMIQGAATVHANGRVCLTASSNSIPQETVVRESSLELQTSTRWYNRMAEEKLNFGSAFQSITSVLVDKKRRNRHAICKTLLTPTATTKYPHESKYVIHPITIDALLQTAIISSSAGRVRSLQGKVPVSVGHLHMRCMASAKAGTQCSIHATAQVTGFEVGRFDTELYDVDNSIMMSMNNIRLIPYDDGSIQSRTNHERHPMLRVLWKPDIMTLNDKNKPRFANYLAEYALTCKGTFANPRLSRMAGALDLLCHKNPDLRILELENDDNDITTSLLLSLNADSIFKAFRSWTRGAFNSSKLYGKTLRLEDLDSPVICDSPVEQGSLFDVVLFPSLGSLYSCADCEYLRSFLAPSAHLIFSTSNVSHIRQRLGKGSFIFENIDNSNIESSICIARTQEADTVQRMSSKGHVTLVYPGNGSTFDAALASQIAASFDCQVQKVCLQDVSPGIIDPGSTVVSTVDLVEPVTETLDSHKLRYLQAIFESASNLIWLSGGRLFQAHNPNQAPIVGLARAVMLEQPAFRFLYIDIDLNTVELEALKGNVITVLRQTITSPAFDLEYLQDKGVLHVSRLVPERQLNKQFQAKEDSQVVELPLSEAGRCQLGIARVGQIDSLHFVQQTDMQPGLEPGFVEVHVSNIGLNAKDLFVLHGKVDTTNATCSLEFTGQVTRTETSVSSLQPGDRVAVLAPSHFATHECVPEWSCVKLEDHEDAATFAAVGVVFVTALYALRHRADIQPGESVLVHSATSAVGLAVIQVAQLFGAEVYATVSTEAKREYLRKSFGIPDDHIFNSRDTSFLADLMKMTDDRGADVVLNFLTGDLLAASWEACAEFGRFVEIGKKDIVDGGRLDMKPFERNVTFTAFDYSSLFYTGLKSLRYREQYRRLLHEAIALVRAGKVQPIPTETFDVSEVVPAMRYLSQSTRIGKIVVTMGNPSSTIKVMRKRYNSNFDPSKAYLMIGCFGGLGRSLSQWMLQQGVRRFCFLGRSGIDKPAARALVEDLEEQGARVVVVRGDVSVYADVQKLVAEAQDQLGPIAGVVHTAMGLDESLFASMSIDAWYKGYDPKIRGTWNLHKALQGVNLDFFFMTSSITGTVGTATESNYCAANAFQDAFARYRRSLGLPAISVGLGMISEVGYLAEHPEIEAVLLRRGLRPITESELLQIIDIALSNNQTSEHVYGRQHHIDGHIVTGFETSGLASQQERGFEGHHMVLDDPRTRLISRALRKHEEDDTSGANGSKNRGAVGLLDSVATALDDRAKTGDGPILQAIQDVVTEKLCNLLLLRKDQLDPQTHLSTFGLDSMLAAEFRQFIYQNFGVDIPFFTLLNKGTTVAGLGRTIKEDVVQRKEGA